MCHMAKLGFWIQSGFFSKWVNVDSQINQVFSEDKNMNIIKTTTLLFINPSRLHSWPVM